MNTLTFLSFQVYYKVNEEQDLSDGESPDDEEEDGIEEPADAPSSDIILPAIIAELEADYNDDDEAVEESDGDHAFDLGLDD